MSLHHTPPGVTLRGDRNCCPGCGKLFNSTKAFDKHRNGTHKDNGRYCLSEDQMREMGMVLRSDGFWVTELRRDAV